MTASLFTDLTFNDACWNVAHQNRHKKGKSHSNTYLYGLILYVLKYLHLIDSWNGPTMYNIFSKFSSYFHLLWALNYWRYFHLNWYNAYIFSYKPWRPKRLFSIWNHRKCLSSLFSLHLNTGYLYGSTTIYILYSFSAGIDFIRQNRMSERRQILTSKVARKELL